MRLEEQVTSVNWCTENQGFGMQYWLKIGFEIVVQWAYVSFSAEVSASSTRVISLDFLTLRMMEPLWVA